MSSQKIRAHETIHSPLCVTHRASRAPDPLPGIQTSFGSRRAHTDHMGLSMRSVFGGLARSTRPRRLFPLPIGPLVFKAPPSTLVFSSHLHLNSNDSTLKLRRHHAATSTERRVASCECDRLYGQSNRLMAARLQLPGQPKRAVGGTSSSTSPWRFFSSGQKAWPGRGRSVISCE